MASTRCTAWCHAGEAALTGEVGSQQGLRISPRVSCGQGCRPAFTVSWLCTGGDNVDWQSGFAGNSYQPLRVIDPALPAQVQVTATVTVSCSPDGAAAQCSTTWLVAWPGGGAPPTVSEQHTTCPGT